MKRIAVKGMYLGLCLLLVTVWGLASSPPHAWADDLDLDGSDCFAEAYGYCAEQYGVYLPAADDLGAFFPNGGCRPDLCLNCPDQKCSNCLTDPVDKDKPDLFVILGNAPEGQPPSLLRPIENDPKYWIKTIEKAKSGTYTLRSHRVNRNPWVDFNRAIIKGAEGTPVQHAIRMYENNIKDLSTGIELGVTPSQGTPNTLNDITIYTLRIDQFVTNTCAGKTCVYANPETGTSVSLTPGSDLTGLKDVYKKQVIAHEAGHTLWLTATPNTKAGGYHYPTGTGTIMDQSVRYTSKGSTVTWYFPAGYAAADQAKLK